MNDHPQALTVNDHRITSAENDELLRAEGNARHEVAHSIVDRLRDGGAALSPDATVELLASAREAVATIGAYEKANDPLVQVESFLRRFVAYPSEHACVAHVLWIAHAHLMESWDSTPRIAFLSPEVGSGKSRALEVSEPLVPNPVESINVSPAYIFRKIGSDDGRPTLLYDEIDTVFGPKAKENEETRGLLNAGHRRHGYAGRCVVRGREIFTEEIPAYCAVALAGLGDLPETILSRCVIVRMRRRAPTEHIEPFRHRLETPKGNAIRDRLAKWADGVSKSVADPWPEMPPGVSDRHADVWEALLAVADAAGGHWPQRARVAAVELVAESKRSTPSLGIRLLGDLKVVFADRDAMSTKDILAALCALEEAPWDDIKGKPINDRSLAFRLKQYQIHSKKIRFAAGTLQGYDRADFHDSWLRYLSEPLIASGTSGTGGTTNAECSGVPDVPAPMGETDRPLICPHCDGEGCRWCGNNQP